VKRSSFLSWEKMVARRTRRERGPMRWMEMEDKSKAGIYPHQNHINYHSTQ